MIKYQTQSEAMHSDGIRWEVVTSLALSLAIFGSSALFCKNILGAFSRSHGDWEQPQPCICHRALLQVTGCWEGGLPERATASPCLRPQWAVLGCTCPTDPSNIQFSGKLDFGAVLIEWLIRKFKLSFFKSWLSPLCRVCLVVCHGRVKASG